MAYTIDQQVHGGGIEKRSKRSVNPSCVLFSLEYIERRGCISVRSPCIQFPPMYRCFVSRHLAHERVTYTVECTHTHVQRTHFAMRTHYNTSRTSNAINYVFNPDPGLDALLVVVCWTKMNAL